MWLLSGAFIAFKMFACLVQSYLDSLTKVGHKMQCYKSSLEGGEDLSTAGYFFFLIVILTGALATVNFKIESKIFNYKLII